MTATRTTNVIEAHKQMAEKLGDITRAVDPTDRAIAALAAYEHMRSHFGPALAAERRQAVRELRATGYSLKECAELLGVTQSRISQLTGS